MVENGSKQRMAYLGFMIHSKGESYGHHVYDCKDVLCEFDLIAFAGKVVQCPEDIYVYSGVYQRSSITLNPPIVAFPVIDLRDLLHVSFPVYLGVCEESRD